jgi:hypothetical protein
VINTFIVIEETPMVVSADDKGRIKVWDIRSYMCIQTIDMGEQTLIIRLLNLIDIGKLVFTGSRLSIVDLDMRSGVPLRKA